MRHLFTPFNLDDLTLPHRVAIAPMTRCRASQPRDIPTELNATYYAQRASAALIITEATNVSPTACAFERSPGIYSDAQTRGWKKVVDSVHERGGCIFLQLWHTGRVGHERLQHGHPPLAPSVTDGRDFLQVYAMDDGWNAVKIQASLPREMTKEEVVRTVNDYGTAARHAKAAGFDGVEIHAANGYLPHQFLSPGTNHRTDAYGGSMERRCRFLLEIIDAIKVSFEASRIGVRISPTAKYNDVADPDPPGTYRYLADRLQEECIGYVHVADTNAWSGKPHLDEMLPYIRAGYRRTLIANGGIDAGRAEALVQGGSVDVVAFGREFLANPDLPERIQKGAVLNTPNQAFFYSGGDERGYTDYPTLRELSKDA